MISILSMEFAGVESRITFYLVNYKSNWKILAVVVFGIFVSTIFVFDLAFASGTVNPNCGLFTVRLDCDLSGWMKLFIGDFGVGAFLALLLHTLSYRHQQTIEKIIHHEQELRERRQNYSLAHLRNLLHLILFTMSLVKRSINQYNAALSEKDSGKQMWIQSNTLSKMRADEAKLGRLLQSTRSLLVASNDVLEPEIVNRVDGVCNFIGELSAEESPDNTMQFPKLHVCRIKVEYLLELLQNHQVSYIPQKKTIEKPPKQTKSRSNPVVVTKVEN